MVERYRTAADWFEEGACIEARGSATIELLDEPRLYWRCECHGERSSQLFPTYEEVTR